MKQCLQDRRVYRRGSKFALDFGSTVSGLSVSRAHLTQSGHPGHVPEPPQLAPSLKVQISNHLQDWKIYLNLSKLLSYLTTVVSRWCKPVQ